MAELINKKDAIAIVNSIPCATLEEECTKSVAVGCIVRLPTTIESEIRALAFSEMHDKLIAYFANWQSEENCIDTQYLLTLVCEGIDEIAEELKEGADNGK